MDLIAVPLNLAALDPDGSFGPISCMIKYINMPGTAHMYQSFTSDFNPTMYQN